MIGRRQHDLERGGGKKCIVPPQKPTCPPLPYEKKKTKDRPPQKTNPFLHLPRPLLKKTKKTLCPPPAQKKKVDSGGGG